MVLISTSGLLRLPILTVGLAIAFAAGLRDTGLMVWYLEQTDTLVSLGKTEKEAPIV